MVGLCICLGGGLAGCDAQTQVTPGTTSLEREVQSDNGHHRTTKEFRILTTPLASPAAPGASPAPPPALTPLPTLPKPYPAIQALPGAWAPPTTQSTSTTVTYDPATGLVHVDGAGAVDITHRTDEDEAKPSAKTRDTASAAGAGISSQGAGIKAEQANQPAKVTIAGVGAGGVTSEGSTANSGGTKINVEAKGQDAGAMWLYGLGGVAIIIGCIACVKFPYMGAAGVLGGIIVIVMGALVAEYKWALAIGFVVVAGGLVVGGVIDWLMKREKARAQELADKDVALKSVARGVEDYYVKNPAVGQVVKDQIQAAQIQLVGEGGVNKVRDTVRSVKRSAKIGCLTLACLAFLNGCSQAQGNCVSLWAAVVYGSCLVLLLALALPLPKSRTTTGRR